MSVLEQLRSQDGKLFQHETILSFYTDIKYFVWTQVSSTLRTSENLEDSKREQLDWSDSLGKETLDKFLALRPDAVDDLQGCLEVYNQILHNSANVFVNETQIQNLLRGLFRRIAQHESFVSKKFLEYDPIKIDFVFREAFRMTLQHDCTVLVRKRQIRFEDTEEIRKVEHVSTDAKTIEPEAHPAEAVQHDFEAETAEHSAAEAIAQSIEAVVESAADAVQSAIEKPELNDTKLDEVRIPSPPASVAGSVVSRAMSAITSVTQLKKPRVRTVILSNDDDNHSRFTKHSRL